MWLRVEIERDIGSLAQAGSAGLILTLSPSGPVHRELIISLASRHKLPAIYGERLFPATGGLLSYGPDFADQYRRPASYVDRILKGEKLADLAVQAHQRARLAIGSSALTVAAYLATLLRGVAFVS